ncbi:DNA polymerase lambda [Lentinula aciculospora]|uniref:DNA polymerase beta n=1 Tax=Lentinula aciculospora TaxID=153920 RepID=A0A9W9DQ00_9AGAR|nr:DNA polymerase lambda [Lentinula aciculospora]
MATTNAKDFFREQEQRMNLSDDDTDDHYIARMTGEDKHTAIAVKYRTANDSTQNIHYASPPRGSKRKTGRLTPLRSSPRIKRSKIYALSEVGALSAANEYNHISDHASAFSVPNDDTSTQSYSRSNQTLHNAADPVNRLKVEPTVIFDEPVATKGSKSRGLSLNSFSDTSSGPSTAPSSPIEEASAFPIPTNLNRKLPEKEKSMLEIILEAKHSRRRRGAKKLVPLALLRNQPKHQPSLADETSIIDDYSSSEVPTSPARSSSPIPEVGTPVQAYKVASKPRVTAAPKLTTKTSAIAKKGKAPALFKKPTPYEFACHVQTVQVNKVGKVQFLEGLRIFYCGMDINSKLSGDSTQKRLMIILRHGGSISTRYQPDEITHIVVDKNLGQNSFLNATGLKKLTDVPEHIPILTWQWVVDMMDNNPFPKNGKFTKIRQVSSLFEYGAYPNRLPPVTITANTNSHEQTCVSKQEAEDGDFCRISEFSSNDIKADVSNNVGSSRHESLGPKQSRRTVIKSTSTRVPLELQSRPPTKNGVIDPLVEFYMQEQANEQRRNEYDSDTDGSDPEPNGQEAGPKFKRDWLCKQPNQNVKPCPNEDIIRKLEELQELHKVKPTEDDHWRVYSYSKSIRALRTHPKRIKSLEDAQKIQGVGKKTAQKIIEIIETGDLQRIVYENTEDVKAISTFTGIYGVGIQTATMWYARGCRTVEDICNGVGDVKLNDGQKIGIEFYDDLNSRMPREEAKAIFELIKPIALRIDPKLFVEIMGSFRRGKSDCGDIDILITRCSDDGRTHEGILKALLEKLHLAGILTEDLALPDYSKPLEAVYHGICRLPDVHGARRRRIDFLTVPWSSKGGALLYYTGDDMFNRSMRLLANKMGYSLNQRGLYAGVVRDPRNRTVKSNIGISITFLLWWNCASILSTGNLIASETEEQIFKALGVPWREPHERVTYYQDIAKVQEAKEKTIDVA